MKVTIQNGSKHGFTRTEAESVVSLLPAALHRNVKSLILYQGTESKVKVSFHPKEQIVGLHWPSPSGSTQEKYEAVEELLIALSIIQEKGKLPEKIGKGLRARHLESLETLCAMCQEVVAKITA